MLGITICLPTLSDHAKNFLIMFFVQLVFLLFEKLPNVPTLQEFYVIGITSMVTTLLFYGYNKVSTKQTKTEDTTKTTS